MTFEQIFAGRLTLMRAQRHICQAYLLGFDHMIPIFRAPEGDAAFWIVENRLVELEREFAEKRSRQKARKRRSLDRRADRQVSA